MEEIVTLVDHAVVAQQITLAVAVHAAAALKNWLNFSYTLQWWSALKLSFKAGLFNINGGTVMKKKHLFFLLCCPLLAGAAESEAHILDNKNFTSVTTSGGLPCEIKKSDTYRVVIKTTKEALKQISVSQSGEALFFETTKNFPKHLLKNTIIIIEMPDLNKLTLDSGSHARFDMKTPHDVTINLSSGASADGELACENLVLGLSSGAELKLHGKGNNIRVAGSTGSITDLRPFSFMALDGRMETGAILKYHKGKIGSFRHETGGEIIQE